MVGIFRNRGRAGGLAGRRVDPDFQVRFRGLSGTAVPSPRQAGGTLHPSGLDGPTRAEAQP